MIPINDDRCTGCTACAHTCPVSAITMEYNKEGFLYPVVDKGICIKCKKCLDACQMFGFKRFPEPQHCYAAWSKHDEVRARSASGGIFYELARKFLSLDGIVCGAAFVGDFEVKHILVEDMEELPKLQASKYLQSDCANGWSL